MLDVAFSCEQLKLHPSLFGRGLKVVFGHSCVLVGRFLYVLFGHQRGTKDDKHPELLSTTCYTLDLLTFQWRRYSRTIGPGRMFATAFLQDDIVFTFGGLIGLPDDFSNEIHCLDTAINDWTPCTVRGEEPIPRASMIGEYIEKFDLFVVFGGNSRGGALDDTHCLSINSLTWIPHTVKGIIPKARHEHCSCVAKTTIFIFGGQNSRGSTLGDLHLLKVCSRKHLVFSAVKSSFLQVYGGTLTFLEGGKLLRLGGLKEAGELESSQIFDLKKNKWSVLHNYKEDEYKDCRFSEYNNTHQYHRAIKWGKDVLVIGGKDDYAFEILRVKTVKTV